MAEQKKHFPQAQILKMFYDICEAVAHMHNQNPPVAHRDLKVDNLLCSLVLMALTCFIYIVLCRLRTYCSLIHMYVKYAILAVQHLF